MASWPCCHPRSCLGFFSPGAASSFCSPSTFPVLYTVPPFNFPPKLCKSSVALYLPPTSYSHSALCVCFNVPHAFFSKTNLAPSLSPCLPHLLLSASLGNLGLPAEILHQGCRALS